jgi:hypothetical protein
MSFIRAIAWAAEKEVAEESGAGGFSQVQAMLISTTTRNERSTRNGFALASTAGAVGITHLPRKGNVSIAKLQGVLRV